MTKYIVLICSIVFLIACGSSKNTNVISENAPEWVTKTPINNANYIGIGMASKTATDFREKALKMALTEISNSISVTVTSSNSLNVFQYDATFNEFYRMNSLITSSSFLEGYDVIDVFEDANFYYTYISLSKQKHLELKKARINKALETSIFKFNYAKKLIAEKDFTEAIKQQILALEDISEFLNEDLRYTENQVEKPYLSHLMNAIFTLLNQIEIQFPVKQLTINHAKDAKEINLQPIYIQLQKKALNAIPVLVNFSWQPGQKTEYTSKNNGTISLSIPRNCSKNSMEKITAFVDTNSLIKNTSNNRVVQKIFENYQPKIVELNITKRLPTIALSIFLAENAKKSLPLIENEVSQLFVKDNFVLANNKTKKDFTLSIENKKIEELQVNGKISIKLQSTILITNSTGFVVYQETIYNIIGIGSSVDLAEKDALQSLVDKIKIVNYNEMVQAML